MDDLSPPTLTRDVYKRIQVKRAVNQEFLDGTRESIAVFAEMTPAEAGVTQQELDTLVASLRETARLVEEVIVFADEKMHEFEAGEYGPMTDQPKGEA